MNLSVNVSQKYTVTVEKDLSAFSSSCGKFLTGKNVAVITDGNVNALYPDALNNFLAGKILPIVLPAGEDSKNGENYFKILNALAENGFTREDCVIAFGGGMVGDISAFAASTYMRGINLIAVPTTILSMVDSSVGGKTAINLTSGKNLCGTFYQPKAVYINTEFITTLPCREFLSGAGEILKYALLSKTVNAKMLKTGVSSELILNCLKVKRDIVQKDEKEKNIRALLNLGHTVGHAIEKLYDYKVSHGECVAKGLDFAVFASEKLYNLPQKTLSEMKKIVSYCGHNLSVDFSAEDIINKIFADKKRYGNEINFIALKAVGVPKIERLSVKTLADIIRLKYGK